MIFTSRERLPAPFEDAGAVQELGRLSRHDAVRLVEQVLAQHGWTPPPHDDGRTPDEVTALVETAQGHARALVLLAPEVARRGVRAVTADLHGLLAELERRHPGQRENSLYASVELSLRRLPPPVRQAIRALAVFQGGGHVDILGMVMGVEPDQARAIAVALIEVGLAEEMPYAYLRLDPALPPYVAGELAAEEIEALRERWAAAMRQWVGFLYGQRFKDAQLAQQLGLLDLPNLLALLDWLPGHAGPEQIVATASSIEQLLANLGQPAALAHAVAVREAAGQVIEAWSRARFNHECLGIERLLDEGKLPRAYQAAVVLYQSALAAGDAAYPGAAYDIAGACWWLGRVLLMSGQADAALSALAEAQRRLQALAGAGDPSAGRMIARVFEEQGGCLMQLGKLEEATTSYQNGADLAEELGDYREVAVNKGNLGAVRLDQGRYAEALAAYEDARAIFERLGEPGTVAGILLQIGVVHRKVRQFEAAERAYRQALGLFVQHKLRADEAANLGELGNLYNDWDRPEPAVAFYRQAADLYTALGDQINEGHTRSNFAETLGKLGRTDEARREIVRAIECNRPFGHTAEPWKTFNILYGIEQAAGNGVAAAAAWRQARDAYLAYRREGGYAQQPSGKILEQLLPAIQAGQGLVAAQAIIAAANDANAPLWLKALAPKLDAILSGERAPSLADDLTLGYDDSAELLLLLERLCPPGERPPVGRPTRATARLHPLPASHKLGEEP